MVTGSGRPPILKTELFVVAPVIVTLAPVALRLPDALPLAPTVTLPKFSVLGETVSWPAEAVPVLPVPVFPCAVDVPELTPWHPANSESMTTSSTKLQATILLFEVGVSQVMT